MSTVCVSVKHHVHHVSFAFSLFYLSLVCARAMLRISGALAMLRCAIQTYMQCSIRTRVLTHMDIVACPSRGPPPAPSALLRRVFVLSCLLAVSLSVV